MSALRQRRAPFFTACVAVTGVLWWRPVGAAPPEPEDSGRELPEVHEGPEAKPETGQALVEAVSLTPRAEPKAVESDTPPEPTVAPQPTTHLQVAIGLAPESPGTPDELAIRDTLRQSLSGSTNPVATLSEFRDGGDGQRRSCRETGAQIIIAVGHLPDRDEPVLAPYDCALARPLGIRAAAAAHDADLLSVLWAEHRELETRGVQDKRPRLTKKARTGLIAGGAALLIAGSVTAILLGTLRSQSTVLKVEPE